jgi:hypothetical protein
LKPDQPRISRRKFLGGAGLAGAGIALGGAYALNQSGRLRLPLSPAPRFPVHPYISRQQHLDALPAPRLSFYKQPWRGYLETVPAIRFLSGIGINYGLPSDADNDAVLKLLADSGVKHIRVEVGWSQVPWDEDQILKRDYYVGVLNACKRYGIVPLILLNANHGAPGPNRAYERAAVNSTPAGARSLVLDSVRDLVSDRSGISNLSDFRMCELMITGIEPAAGRVALSKPLPKEIAAGTKVSVHTLKYLPLHPVGSQQLNETLAGWQRYVDLVLRLVVESGVREFEVEIWNELAFGSDYLSIDNYYEKPVARDDHDTLLEGGRAWELGRRTVDQVKRSHPGAKVIWGFSNTDFYHTPIAKLPPGLDGQSYHPYGTARQRIPEDFPPKDRSHQFAEGFVPHISWCMPEGWAHLATKEEQIMRSMLDPVRRAANLPAGATSFAHYMTEHGFVAKEAGVTEKKSTQSYKAKAMIRSLTFWLNKGVSRVHIYTLYEDSDSQAGILWSEPPPPRQGRGEHSVRSPALTALTNLVRQFQGAEELSHPRQLGVEVVALGEQPKVFPGSHGSPSLFYREMFAFLPFQVSASRFVVATYVMSYDITAPPPPMNFQLEITGVAGRRARARYYDPIQDRDVAHSVEGRSDTSLVLALEQMEYPRLILLDEG